MDSGVGRWNVRYGDFLNDKSCPDRDLNSKHSLDNAKVKSPLKKRLQRIGIKSKMFSPKNFNESERFVKSLAFSEDIKTSLVPDQSCVHRMIRTAPHFNHVADIPDLSNEVLTARDLSQHIGSSLTSLDKSPIIPAWLNWMIDYPRYRGRSPASLKTRASLLTNLAGSLIRSFATIVEFRPVLERSLRRSYKIGDATIATNKRVSGSTGEIRSLIRLTSTMGTRVTRQ